MRKKKKAKPGQCFAGLSKALQSKLRRLSFQIEGVQFPQFLSENGLEVLRIRIERATCLFSVRERKQLIPKIERATQIHHQNARS